MDNSSLWYGVSVLCFIGSGVCFTLAFLNERARWRYLNRQQQEDYDDTRTAAKADEGN